MKHVVSRLVSWKYALVASGRWPRHLIPALEVAEVWLTHGPREVATRVRRRFGSRTGAPPTGYRAPSTFDIGFPPLGVPRLDSANGVSIVIPVFNHASVTHACLSAIIEHTEPGAYEVIVVDNASDSATQTMLKTVGGLHVIRNETNEGFVDACNQGAAVARGTHILFLNNDTAVLPGWLPPLVATFDRIERVGAVGAKLLYPDGHLQEAGSIIWSDGSGWNYGKHADADAPEFNYARPVDYCSGACLLVRKSAWEALAGFDGRYAPAYYEDADLCFRLREHGYLVYYQPASRVVHHEGRTAGTDEATGFKHYQRRNRERFVEQHRAALEHQSPHDPRLLRRACDRRRGRRVLVVDDMVPQHDRNAGSVRARAILQILVELGHRVTLLPDNRDRPEPYTSELQQLGVEVLYGPLASVKWVEDHVHDFDVIILCRALFAAKFLPAVDAARRRPYVIFDTVDLHHLREERRAELEGDDDLRRLAARTRSIEMDVIVRSDMIWVTSAHEAVLLSGHAAGPIEIVPTIDRVADNVPPFAARQGLLFIGGFRHPPNEDAITYFVRNVFPLVLDTLPEVQLHIVGSDMPASVLALASARVVVHGFVEDVTPLFHACRLSVAPLRYGAGVKGKVSQSLALGLPVVTTPVGAEGMNLNHGEHVLIGSTADELAELIVSAYSDEPLWTTLSQQGRAHLRSTMGYEIIRDRIQRLIA